MFGVMQYKACSQTDEQRDEHRLHYCGTCKTMGAVYGQASRFLLNNDAVFLAELLSAIAPADKSYPDWVKEYQSFNCMLLPSDSGDFPLALRIAADVIMLLTEMKIDDHLEDTRNKNWNIAKRFFSEPCRLASESLESHGFKIADIWEDYRQQSTREAFVKANASSFSHLHLIDYCATPTGKITAAVFKSAGAVVGQPQDDVGIELQSIGDSFGRLIYVLDAIDDYSHDLRRKHFNPFLVAYDLDSATFPDQCREEILPYVRAQVTHIEKALRRLPISADVAARFGKRLRDSVTGKLGIGWSACATNCSHQRHRAKATPRQNNCLNLPVSWEDRYRQSWQQSDRLVAQTNSPTRRIFARLAVWFTAWLFPLYARQSKTLEQCLSIPMNLIAWTTFINELLTVPKSWVPAFAAMSSGSTGGGGGDDGGYVYGTGYGASGHGGTFGDEHGKEEQSGSGRGISESGAESEGGEPGQPAGPTPEPNRRPGRGVNRAKRSKKSFGSPEPEPSPELLPLGEGGQSYPPSRDQSGTGGGTTGYSGRQGTYLPYRTDPARVGWCCCADCCANVGCNICAECACESCQCCECADCCGSTGGAECCGSSGGADCCGSAHCCGGADCAACDCGACDCGACDCGACDCGSADCSGCSGCN